MSLAHSNVLVADLYQFNMVQAYLEHGLTEEAVFEFFVRKLPPTRGFLCAAGLEQVVGFLENLRFTAEELDWLQRSQHFTERLLDFLCTFRFTGDIDAMPEGTIFFPYEPILRVTAPLPEAQFIETRLLNILHFQSVIASKAARMVLAVPRKTLVDFGFRRAHGAEAGLWAARASYIAGFSGTATVLAEAEFGVPAFGTMAHSFVQVHASEREAFENFARSNPGNLVLLIDTYDVDRAARVVAKLVPKLRAEGIEVHGVRLDSGDLGLHARNVRRVLDAAGHTHLKIFASGGLDEEALLSLERQKAPIDGYGIGTSLTTSSDTPALDCAYKIQEYAGIARRKRSEGKATWPGRKQVWREYGPDGRIKGDTLALEGDRRDGRPLLQPIMRTGRLIDTLPRLQAIRAYAAAELASLPEPLRQLQAERYPVTVAPSVTQLAEECDRRVARIAAGLDA